MYRISNDSRMWGTEIGTTVDSIAKVERVLKNKKAELEDLQYEIDVLKQKRLSVYKTGICYLIYDFMANACKWDAALRTGKLNGEKIDKRKKYDEKISYEYIKGWLDERFGAVAINRMYDYNFGEATGIDFSVGESNWTIEIPNVAHVSSRALDDYGPMAFAIRVYYQEQEHCRTLLFYTFEEDKIKQLLEEKAADKKLL